MFDQVAYQYDVFISYHLANRLWVQHTLCPRLQAAGLRVIDDRNFQVGVPTLDNIERAVDTSRHTLIVMTPEWLNSMWGEFEGLLAQTPDPAGRRRRLIPLLLEPSRLPSRIAMLKYADFTGSAEQDEAEMQRLLRGLATKSRVFLSFKRGIEPDQSLATHLRQVLEREGHDLHTDEDVTVGMSYHDSVQQQIARSDYLVVLLSKASVRDEELADQIGYAHRESAAGRKARLLPVRVDYNEALPDPLDGYLKDLGYALWRDRDDDERVSRQLLDAMSTFAALSPPIVRAEQATPEGIASPAKLWPSGSVIRLAFLDGDPAVQWKVAKAAMEWIKYANLRFVFGDGAEAAVRISFKQPGSWSLQGTDALAVPKDQPTINFGWLTPDTPEGEIRRVVLHEFGHMLGLVHEHQLANADIPWDKEAVYRSLSGPPNYWTRQQVDLTWFQKYPHKYFPIEKGFDLKSIMIFPIAKEFVSGAFEVGWNAELSAIDKAFVQRLYPSA
ncbi:MAG TPA: TIR domain-containing protein [Candidatus Tectomicrobia bacterium]|nr:TIR domain-containing protein [Candidatus Tectomicrobia bacterium]